MQSYINMCRRYFVHMKPDVFGEAVFDELLILVLVDTHENCVIPSLWSGLKVEHHLFFLLLLGGNN
uniref:Coiled-coil domain-containing protein 25 n=1 Tax=Rhizophora mucronata TaxID=61149 RepID=A0A2P2KXU3_RHIMU